MNSTAMSMTRQDWVSQAGMFGRPARTIELGNVGVPGKQYSQTRLTQHPQIAAVAMTTTCPPPGSRDEVGRVTGSGSLARSGPGPRKGHSERLGYSDRLIDKERGISVRFAAGRFPAPTALINHCAAGSGGGYGWW